jgi:hypothetical protein
MLQSDSISKSNQSLMLAYIKSQMLAKKAATTKGKSILTSLFNLSTIVTTGTTTKTEFFFFL